MSSKRGQSSHWLNQRWWKFAVSEWLVLLLTFLVLILLFCLFFIRRHTLEYRFDHTFGVRDPVFFGSALALSDPVPIDGTKIEILTNGDEYFPPMLEAIRAARQTVNFAAYIFESDEIGRQFRDLFCEQARAGIEVRILLDGIGSSWGLDNSDVRMMRNAGCKFAYYHPTASWRVDRTNRRLHRRLLVVDGHVAFTGSAGFGTRWSGHAQDKDHWRDTQVRVEGPIVAKLQATFNEHWIKTFGETLSGIGQFPVLAAAGTAKAQVVASHSFSMAPVPLVLATAFAAAEKRIWITNPYCTPTSDQVDLLIAAVQRKVDVRLILPGENNDQPLTKSAGRSAYGRMLEGGVRIFEYQPAMIHTKSMVIDGLFSMVGSSNFDSRSSGINEELDLVVYDEAFGREMERVFESDLQRTREYRIEDYRKRSFWERTTEWLALPFRSQL